MRDRSIFVRAELSRLQRWRDVNPAEECRRRDFEPRAVGAIIVFGERSLLPSGSEEFPQLLLIVLAERMPEVEASAAGRSLAALLRPVIEAADEVVEARAAADYRELRQSATLSEEDRHCFSGFFMQFLMQRFRQRKPRNWRWPCWTSAPWPIWMPGLKRTLLDRSGTRAAFRCPCAESAYGCEFFARGIRKYEKSHANCWDFSQNPLS